MRKHGEVMSEKHSKHHFVGYIQNGNCQIEKWTNNRVVGATKCSPKGVPRKNMNEIMLFHGFFVKMTIIYHQIEEPPIKQASWTL